MAPPKVFAVVENQSFAQQSEQSTSSRYHADLIQQNSGSF